MFVFSKGAPSSFNPISDRRNKLAGTKLHGTDRHKDGTTKPIGPTRMGKVIPEYGTRFNVWCMPGEKKNKTGHPAPFPENIANDHIITWSNEGDTVLDCFMGSGTTGKMAVLNGRNFIGIELDDEYFEIAKQRISEARNKPEQITIW